MKTVADYFKDVPEAQKAEYNRIKRVVKEIVPDAEEVISYGIPTFKHKGKYVLYVGAFKDHMSVFPGAPIDLKDKLEGFKVSKGTIQFTLDNPLPSSIVKELVEKRLKDLDETSSK